MARAINDGIVGEYKLACSAGEVLDKTTSTVGKGITGHDQGVCGSGGIVLLNHPRSSALDCAILDLQVIKRTSEIVNDVLVGIEYAVGERNGHILTGCLDSLATRTAKSRINHGNISSCSIGNRDYIGALEIKISQSNFTNYSIGRYSKVSIRTGCANDGNTVEGIESNGTVINICSQSDYIAGLCASECCGKSGIISSLNIVLALVLINSKLCIQCSESSGGVVFEAKSE